MLIEDTVITCGHQDCGITFAVPTRWLEQKRRDHSTFWCPNGHGRAFHVESEEEKLRRERDRLSQRLAEKEDAIQQALDQRDTVQRRLTATKAVVTRIKNRVGHGVCPCCSRSFQNLQRHMASEHAGYARSTEETRVSS